MENSNEFAPFHVRLIALIEALDPATSADIAVAQQRVAETIGDTEIPAVHLDEIETALINKEHEVGMSDCSYTHDIIAALIIGRQALKVQRQRYLNSIHDSFDEEFSSHSAA